MNSEQLVVLLMSVVISSDFFQQQVYCREIKSISPKVISVTQSEEATFKWIYTNDKSESINIQINRGGKQICSCTIDFQNGICQTLLIQKYICIIDVVEKIITLNVRNVSYDDQGDYHGMVMITSPSVTNKDGHMTDITLIVEGPPKVCGDGFQTFYNFNENTAPMLNVTICGYPRPQYKWTFLEQKLGYSEKVLTDSHKYIFFGQLPKLNRHMCGKDVTFTATNSYGELKISAKILMKFELPIVNELQVRYLKQCQDISWQIISSGFCEVQYEIRTLNTDNRLMSAVTTQAFVQNVRFCFAQQNIHTELKVEIRAKYGNRYGSWSSVSEAKKAKKFESDKTVLISGLTCGGIVLLLIMIALLFYIKRERRKNGNEVWTPKTSHKKESTKTQLMDVSLLEIKSSSQSDGYVDMSLNNYSNIKGERSRYPIQPTYAKINVDDGIYENMDDIKKSSVHNEYENPNQI